MKENMSENNQVNLSIKSIWQALFKNKYLFVKVICLAFVVACLLSLCIPNYYRVRITLAPELSSGRSSSSSLSSLASSFGVSVGGSSSSNDALTPMLYPDMMNSVGFMTSLFPIQVHELGSDETMTYYEYLLDHQRYPWWTTVIGFAKKAVLSIPKLLLAKSKETGTKSSEVDPFMLTKEQSKIIKGKIRNKISCDVDQKTLVITISVTDQDPLIAAVMADSVKQRLQDAITAYRTSKARVDLEYNEKLLEETKRNYDDARQKYAAFADANQNMILQSARSRLIELENDMQIKYQAYSTVAGQVQTAKAKVQQDTPAFTTLQNATVPVEKSGPSRGKMVILFCMLATVCSCCYVLHKEGYFVPLFRLFLGLRQKKS